MFGLEAASKRAPLEQTTFNGAGGVFNLQRVPGKPYLRSLLISALFLLAGAAFAQQETSSQPTLDRVEDAVGPTGRQAVESMLAQPRGFIGIQMLNLTDGLREYFGVERGVGVLVAEVGEDGPAMRAGIKPGDVILSINGTEVDSSVMLANIIGSSKDAVVLEAQRSGSSLTVEVTVELRRTILVKLSPTIVKQRIEYRGTNSGQADGGKITRVTVNEAGESEVVTTELDLGVDQLSAFFSSDGLRRKMDRLEELDLKELEQRIKTLESDLLALEKQIPEAKKPPGKN